MTRLMNSAGDDLCAKSKDPRVAETSTCTLPYPQRFVRLKQMVGHIDAEGTLKAAKDVHRLKSSYDG